MQKHHIKIVEAAQLLGCSSRTVLRMIDSSVLEGWKLTPRGKSVYYVAREDVEKIIKQRKAAAK
jgi:excisionase family DNA binding protein